MCGIAGILSFEKPADREVSRRAVRKMAALMSRRGPDDEFFWSDPEGRLELGFRRLSVLDLSAAGRQPMISSSGRSIIVFNGEIYNYKELRRELEAKGARFRSQSDTEVLLEALELWGESAISRFNGMFGFAWYSLAERKLVLARDHAGIKPLYYFTDPGGKGLAFASQLNALLHVPFGKVSLRAEALHLYLRYQHFPAPYTPLEHAAQLEPGHYLVVKNGRPAEKKAWWRFSPDASASYVKNPAGILSETFRKAVARQRAADVPVGVFLSGGIDSPLVAAVARKQTGADLKAFTVSNPGWSQDEGEDARRYARRLEVHQYVQPMDASGIVETASEAMNAQYEPLADFSILPTLLVSRLARKHVTVALSGDGGDELFFGYERSASLLGGGMDFRLPWAARAFLYIAGKHGFGPKRSSAIVARDPGDYYAQVNGRFSETDIKKIFPNIAGSPADYGLYHFKGPVKSLEQLAHFSQWAEYYGGMQGILKKVDMASMHYSLEVRVPVLDREVVETALKIDPFECMREGKRKVVLRRLLSEHVSTDVVTETKKGFSIPLNRWLRSELKDWAAERLLDEGFNKAFGMDRVVVEKFWNDFLSGRKSDLKWGIWTLVCLQGWYRGHFLKND